MCVTVSNHFDEEARQIKDRMDPQTDFFGRRFHQTSPRREDKNSPGRDGQRCDGARRIKEKPNTPFCLECYSTKIARSHGVISRFNVLGRLRSLSQTMF